MTRRDVEVVGVCAIGGLLSLFIGAVSYIVWLVERKST